MLNATRTRIIQTMLKGITIVILIIAPQVSYSQSNDLCRVTIESVKCVKPSTGQDAYTAFLFKGIEIAIKAGAAVATGGSSLTATAALEIAKEAAKKVAKAGIQIAATNQAKNVFAANKDEIMALANIGGANSSGQPSNLAKTAGVALEVYQLTSLQGMFNKIYGESPDALYIKMNGAKVWPSAKSVEIKSQQSFAVNASTIVERSKGFSIQLMEYDYGSNDDDLGIQHFEIPGSFMGTERVVDQVYYHKEEGSFYMITFKVESLLKHKFINEIVGSLWDQTTWSGTTTMAFGGGTIIGNESGITWKITGEDKIDFCVNDRPYMHVTFLSENSLTGTYIQQNPSGNQVSYTAKRRPLEHRFAGNLIGSTWDYYHTTGQATTKIRFGNGTVDFLEQNAPGVTWKFLAADYVAFYSPDKLKEMRIMFQSANSFEGKGWDGTSRVAGIRSQQQQQQQQQQQTTLQHRFINNLAGTSWNFNEPGQPAYTFSFGQGNITNFSSPGSFWDAVTWKPVGNDIIELRTANGATMSLVFTDANNFSGISWNNSAITVTGSNRQGQQQTFQHQFINNIVGTSWNYADGAGTFTFNIGQNTIDNFSYPGVGWEGATWKVIGNDKIQLRATNGGLMDLTFNSPNSFSGSSWNNNINMVTGTIRQAQQQQQSQFQHRFINNIIGSSWNYNEPDGNPAKTFNFGNGTITNFSIPGTFWDAVTWKVIGNDKIQLLASNGAAMDITFHDQNNFSGYYWNDGVNIVSGTNRQAQGQQQQQSPFQHQFINNLAGTSWNYTEPGNGTFSFTIGQGVITNFSTPGTYWDGVTWTISGKDQIQLRTTTGAIMDLFFSDKNNFSGYYWNSGTNNIVTGTNRQPQY